MMKPTIALAVLAGLAGLAAPTAMAQQGPAEPPSWRGSASTPSWRSPGEPLAAAQTTRAYVPNRDVVAAVQQRLTQLGYATTVSGNYDANLRNNVLRFQSATGLRPTGEIDLSTIGALGINVQPVGVAPATAMAPPPPAPVVQQQAMARPLGRDQLLERDESMSSAQTRHQSSEFENTAGVTLPADTLQAGEQPPGFPPGYPAENLELD